MKRRGLSLLLIFTMLLALMPTTVFATDVSISENLADTEIVADATDGTGFPEYVKILPEGTAYEFSENETSIFFPASELELIVGDTFVLYIGDYPAAYVAENVTMEETGMTVTVSKAPAAVYENVQVNTDLSVSDAIVMPNEEADVSSVIEGDSVILLSAFDAEAEGNGTISVTLSGFHICTKTNELSVNYELKFNGDFTGQLTRELAKIRFLGVGTFVFSIFGELDANGQITQRGTFEFALDSDPSSDGYIVRDDGTSFSSDFEAEADTEVKLGLQVSVGVDAFVADAQLFTATAGVAGKVTMQYVDDYYNPHTHSELEYYGFLTCGIVSFQMGGELHSKVKRLCKECTKTYGEKDTLSFEAAVETDGILNVNTDALEALLEVLPRMLCGDRTIDQYTELEKDCSVEAYTLTIAENQTLVVNGDMKQRGNIELKTGASLIVRGDYLQEAGTLTLGEDANLEVHGDYTMKSSLKDFLNGGTIKLELSVGGSITANDEDGTELSGNAEGCYEISDISLCASVLNIGTGADISILGDLLQEGGEIKGGYYTKAFTITIGEEGSVSGGNYTQTGGKLKVDDAFNILIHGNYSLSGGTAYLSHNQNGPGAIFEVGKDYIQSGGEAKVSCDMFVSGNVDLSGNAQLNHGSRTMTIVGNITQSGESVFNASNSATMRFQGGNTHVVDYEAPDNCNLGTVVCDNPETDLLDVPNGMPSFWFGSDVEIIGNLRLVSGENPDNYEWFNGHSLTVRGDLIQQGCTLGSLMNNSEPVQIEVHGDYIIADGRLRAKRGTVNVGGDLLLMGYDEEMGTVVDTEPSTGGLCTDDVNITVGGSVEIFCKIEDGNDAFEFNGPIDGATLSIQGDLIQRNCEGSDPNFVPFELSGDFTLLFNGKEAQTIAFETEPKIGNHVVRGRVINLNFKGLNWGDNTEPLKNILLNPFSDVADTDWFYVPVIWAYINNVTGGTSETTFGPNDGCTRAQVVTFLWAANGKPEPKSMDNPFIDVADDAWYLKPVLWAVENGITGGVSADQFGPEQTCTRAQIATFLYAAAGKPEVSGKSEFSDVLDTDWFAKPIIWAAQNDVTGGIGDGKFGPNNTCTRAQVVTFLYKVYGVEAQ